MSTIAITAKRHALGLPEGSIRATHTLLIVGLFCAMMLVDTRPPLAMPPYLIYLLFMVLGHYFAHRSGTRAGTTYHPLYLPRGCVRFLVMVGLVATIGWCLYHDPDKVQHQFDESLEALKTEPLLPLFILGSFFLGVVVRAVVGRENPPYFLQDMEAWLSLVSIVGLAVAAVIHLIIQPSLESTLHMPVWEAILASVISFYFGERS
ncbi:MAG TPA: hypothetical protein VNX28_04925 [Gemmataceae bacterium]|jgi:hypothetical protein|nr:hypothetical protein [Gemmataceae bacterium]